jgi:cytochrome c-type biogenesis protein CcmE
MIKKYRMIGGIAVIVVFGGLALWSLKETATPYVGFQQARSMQKIVQVLGKVEHDKANYDEKTGIFSFHIVDESGDWMKVNYLGIKPGGFEQAESVVCVGRYKDGVFVANLLLVKCPSKYQGAGKQDKVI